jgi:hypothetical protein
MSASSEIVISRAIMCKSGSVDISKGKQSVYQMGVTRKLLSNSTPLKIDFREYIGIFKLEHYIFQKNTLIFCINVLCTSLHFFNFMLL